MIFLEPGPPSFARFWLNARKLTHAVPPEIKATDVGWIPSINPAAAV
jgi:hypothetical protein